MLGMLYVSSIEGTHCYKFPAQQILGHARMQQRRAGAHVRLGAGLAGSGRAAHGILRDLVCNHDEAPQA